MKSVPTDQVPRITRRTAIQRTAEVVSMAALSQLSGIAETSTPSPGAAPESGGNAEAREKLRVATCQFPVSDTPVENAKHVRDFMRQAAAAGAHLLHTSEAALSGYPGTDLRSFEGYDWEKLRAATAELRELAKALKLWLVLGSAHFLDARTKPTNCLYLIDPEGRIADRYDKCFCTATDHNHYSSGDRLVTHTIRGVRIGLAICYDICWPQLYIGYREQGASVMIHSFHNARSQGPNCLDLLNVRQVPTRCADNRLWAVCNNSAQPYCHWGSFIARPDASIAKQLDTNRPGMLVHDFPDGLSPGGWYHNHQPMRKRDDEIMSWGKPSTHPRQADGRAEP